ncbi:hypothetical protein [Moorena sp. SIO4G3]|uniref:hypothetical protein n=1 Tax=Moorena sp. SIO4G3 TaxID=2607821 RepID=UPI0025E60359|nr:hypothetical protein [Moorena sp. SIO4G3]
MPKYRNYQLGEDGEIGREMGRSGGRWGDGAGDGEMGRWGDGENYSDFPVLRTPDSRLPTPDSRLPTEVWDE